MKKITIALIALMIVGIAPSAFGQTLSTSDLQNKIQSLLTQLKSLQDQQSQLQQQKKSATAELVSTLKQGMSGDQVSTLQALLAAEQDIYPDAKITGYYGQLTAKAVKRFQKKYGISENGSVDARTLNKLRELLEDHPVALISTSSTSSARLCAIVPPGHLIAKGWLKKNKAPIIPVCQEIPIGILIKLGLATGTPSSTVDVVSPLISNLSTKPATSSAVVTWNTNERASSQVIYGTSSSSLASSTNLDSGLSFSHSTILSGLNASTTYFFSVQSRDASGNLATSSVQSFTTSIAPDLSAPVISSVAATSTSNSITVNWSTNEPASSQIAYGASSTLGFVTALDSTLVASHSQMFSGLNSSTTYFFSVQSRDASGNLATSSQYTINTQ